MTKLLRITALFATFSMLALLAVPLSAQAHAKEDAKMQHAKGTFDVKMAPIPAATGDTTGIAKMSIDKQFHGDLDAHSLGTMMSLGDPRSDAGYVAMETVTGTLNGKHGSFALQHSGTIVSGKPWLSIMVVPGSGTGDLVGISGTFNLVFESGKHSYVLDYSLPPAP